jgi:hypothetical protein
MDRYFLLRVQPKTGAPAAAYLKADAAFMAWAQEAYKMIESLRRWDEGAFSILAYSSAFVFLHDVGLLDEEDQLTLECGNVQLAKALVEPNVMVDPKAKDAPYGQVTVKRNGLSFMSMSFRTTTLTWAEIGIETDNIRCRYNDCVEAHPVAGENELVSCPTCRASMGLEV